MWGVCIHVSVYVCLYVSMCVFVCLMCAMSCMLVSCVCVLCVHVLCICMYVCGWTGPRSRSGFVDLDPARPGLGCSPRSHAPSQAGWGEAAKDSRGEAGEAMHGGLPDPKTGPQQGKQS